MHSNYTGNTSIQIFLKGAQQNKTKKNFNGLVSAQGLNETHIRVYSIDINRSRPKYYAVEMYIDPAGVFPP